MPFYFESGGRKVVKLTPCSGFHTTLDVCGKKRLIAIATAQKQDCALVISPGTSRNPLKAFLENLPHVKM